MSLPTCDDVTKRAWRKISKWKWAFVTPRYIGYLYAKFHKNCFCSFCEIESQTETNKQTIPNFYNRQVVVFNCHNSNLWEVQNSRSAREKSSLPIQPYYTCVDGSGWRSVLRVSKVYRNLNGTFFSTTCRMFDETQGKKRTDLLYFNKIIHLHILPLMFVMVEEELQLGLHGRQASLKVLSRVGLHGE